MTAASRAHAPTLTARLLTRAALTMLLGLATLTIAVMLIFQSHLNTLQDRSLLGQAEDLRRALVASSSGAVALALPQGLARQYASSPQSARYAILDRNGGLIAASPTVRGPLDPLSGPGDSGGPSYFRFTDPETGQVLIGISLRANLNGADIIVQAAQSLTHYDVLADGLFDELADEAGWAIVLIFVLVLSVLYITVRRTLQPLQRASAEAALVGPDAPEARVSATDLPGEIQPLVSAINQGVDRLQRAFAMQREFTDNAAHELRTPIAVLRTHLDTLPRDDSVKALSRQVGVLERIVDQLLRLARLEGERLAPGESADLAAVARGVAEMMAPEAIRRGVDLSLDADAPVPVKGRAALLEIAARNLVENAIHAAGRGGTVHLTVAASPAPTLTVEDSGPGVPEAERARIFERFVRKGRADSDGAGLGLSIVATIVGLHNAQVSIDTATLGGAAFHLRFPDFRNAVRHG